MPDIKPMNDSTLYRIETQSNLYHGRIIHQDGKVIMLVNDAGKSVKILKENVKNISIVRSYYNCSKIKLSKPKIRRRVCIKFI